MSEENNWNYGNDEPNVNQGNPVSLEKSTTDGTAGVNLEKTVTGNEERVNSEKDYDRQSVLYKYVIWKRQYKL